MAHLSTSATGLDLIKAFEGFRAVAAPLDAGGWVIGYGHTASAKQGARIDRKDAADLLRWDVHRLEEPVQDLVYAPLNQNQFDALISFVFNIGMDHFRSSAVLRHLNEGCPVNAAEGFDAWRCANLAGKVIVVNALVRRRAAEKALFLASPGGNVVAPTPQVPPLHDAKIMSAYVRETPQDVTVDMNGAGELQIDAHGGTVIVQPEEGPEEENADLVPLDDVFANSAEMPASGEAAGKSNDEGHDADAMATPIAVAAQTIIEHLDHIGTGETDVGPESALPENTQGAEQTRGPDEESPEHTEISASQETEESAATRLDDEAAEPPLLHTDAPAIKEDADFQPARERGKVIFILMGIIGIGLIVSGLWQLQANGGTVAGTHDLVMGPGQAGLGLLLVAVSTYSLLRRLKANTMSD